MHQQLWGYKVIEKLYVGVREKKRLNTAGINYQYEFCTSYAEHIVCHNITNCRYRANQQWLICCVCLFVNRQSPSEQTCNVSIYLCTAVRTISYSIKKIPA